MRKDIEGIEFRYEGDRFEGGRLPVVMLPDLSALRELMIAYAKDEWRVRNPAAKGLGKAFTDRIGIDLMSITNKCALLKLQVTSDPGDKPNMDTSELEVILSGSKDVRHLYSQANKGIFPKHLHTNKFQQVKVIGRFLGPDEHIVIGANDNGEPIVVDQASREGILKNSLEVTEERIYGRGHLFGAQVDGVVSIHSQDHGKLKVKVPDEMAVSLGGSLSKVVCYDLKANLKEDRSVKGRPEVVMVHVMSPEELALFDASSDKIRRLATATIEAKNAAFRILGQRPLLADRLRASSNGDEGILFEFNQKGWMWSIETNKDGSCEMYGIELEGPSEIQPVQVRCDDDFIDMISDRIGDGRV